MTDHKNTMFINTVVNTLFNTHKELGDYISDINSIAQSDPIEKESLTNILECIRSCCTDIKRYSDNIAEVINSDETDED